MRVLSLLDWGYSPRLTGQVESLEWDEEGKTLAVGFKLQGMVLWTVSGTFFFLKIIIILVIHALTWTTLRGNPFGYCTVRIYSYVVCLQIHI